MIRTIIKPQLSITSLGKWRERGHQICNYCVDPNDNTKIASTCDRTDTHIEIDWEPGRRRMMGKRYIENVDDDNLYAGGDGTIRDQWGAIAWSFVSKNKFEEISMKTAPLDSNPYTIKKIESRSNSCFDNCNSHSAAGKVSKK